MNTLRARPLHRPLPWSAMVAGVVLLFNLVPAAGDERGRDQERRGKPEQHRDREHRDRDRHGYVRGNYYPQPIYVPPVVQYVPPQSPGISLFVPLDIRLR